VVEVLLAAAVRVWTAGGAGLSARRWRRFCRSAGGRPPFFETGSGIEEGDGVAVEEVFVEGIRGMSAGFDNGGLEGEEIVEAVGG